MKDFRKFIGQSSTLQLDSVVGSFEKGLITIPKFQREYVWNDDQASLYIQSLLYQLPTPGIVLATNNLGSLFSGVLIDGLQRLTSLKRYCNDELQLTNVVDAEILNASKEDILTNLRFRSISVIQVFNDKLDENTLKRIFVLINRAGTRIDDKYLDEIEKTINL